MRVRSAQEFEAVLDAAVGIGAEIQFFPRFHSTGFEGAMHLVLQELQCHLRAHNFDLRIEIDQVADQAGVVGLGMAHDQHIDCGWIDLLHEQGDPGLAELGVTGVDQCGPFSPHQKGVVGGAVAQAEFDVEAAAVPIQGAKRAGVGGNGFALQRQLRSSRSNDHETDHDGNELYGDSSKPRGRDW